MEGYFFVFQLISKIILAIRNNNKFKQLQEEFKLSKIDIESLEDKMKKLEPLDGLLSYFHKNKDIIPKNDLLTIEILERLSFGSKNAINWDYSLNLSEIQEICKNLKIADEFIEIKSSIFSLEDNGLITLLSDQSNEYGFIEVSPSDIFFVLTDGLFQQTSPSQDGLFIINHIIEKDKVSNDVSEKSCEIIQRFKEKTNWSTRRINSALKYLEINELVEELERYCGCVFFADQISLTNKAYYVKKHNMI
ncbi:MAG: hypothetical protein PHF86_06295 [Candidatus Nanoarchaeia archaeon]|nr:hypothetical protein [Candidatus Nanoarchaeia archaeon]